MNKRADKNTRVYDDKEDFEITKIANTKKTDTTHRILLIILIILFCLTLFISISYIIHYGDKKSLNDNKEIIEIKTREINLSIINSGLVSKKITSETFGEKKQIVLENINVIELQVSDKNESNKVNYNVKYNITKNDFKINNIASNNSEVLVKFSYSYDKEEWTYINNVISTSSSNISPLIGNTYDIAGLINNLNVATNMELEVNDGNSSKIYWRSETIFKNIEEVYADKELEANFIIEYKSS